MTISFEVNSFQINDYAIYFYIYIYIKRYLISFMNCSPILRKDQRIAASAVLAIRNASQIINLITIRNLIFQV
jgi:hypothetical protein